MSGEAVQWSEEKQQYLQEQLTGRWLEDVWAFKDGRYIRFPLVSPSLKIELKYAIWQKFERRQWNPESNISNQRSLIAVVIQWLNHFVPPIQSLLERSLAQWELSLQSYLVQTNQLRIRRFKRLLATQKYVEYEQADPRIHLFRQLYAIIADVYDDRPEAAKDIWNLHKLGVAVNPTRAESVLNFSAIAQPWLKQLAKQFIQYNLAIHSAGDCQFKIQVLRRFSEFLEQCYPTTTAKDIDRALMIHFISALRMWYPSDSTRNRVLSHLRTFLETCAHRLLVPHLTKEYLIFADDFPLVPKTAPRDIPEEVLMQVRDHLKALPTTILRMVVILLECGLRINELGTLPVDCLIRDDRNEWYLRFYQSKSHQDHVIPLIDEKVIGTIQAQQEDIRAKWGNRCPYLFPSDRSHLRPYQQLTFRQKLNAWAVKHQIKDQNGRQYRLQSHQFRHTMAMRLLNDDVPLEVISRLLGHRFLAMTQVYARVRDKKLRMELERAARKRKTVDYQGNAVKGDARANDPEAQMTRKGVRGQTLPVGGCGRLVVLGECSHANKCLTCPMWLTSTDDLPKLKSFYERAIRLKQRATDVGNQIVAQQQDHIISTLAVRIQTLDATEMDGSLCVDDVLAQLKNDLMETESGLEEAQQAGLVLAARHLRRAIVEIKARIAALEEVI